jgi:endonuclease/exonuclease/phosphatase family metal-dependent hydrolase
MSPRRDAAVLDKLLKADGVAASGTAPQRRPILPTPPSEPCRPDEVMVAHYSLENLFDTVDDPATMDEEYTPQNAEMPYDEARLVEHMTNMGAAIRSMNGGKGPDILSLTEIENRGVLERFNKEALGDLGYKTVAHIEGPDSRGIEPAVISRYAMIGEPKQHPIVDAAGKKQRGILEVTLDVNGHPLTVFVNHWVAGRGGDDPKDAAKLAERRKFAASVLQGLMDQKLAANPNAEFVVLGDFNETLNAPALGSIKAETAEAARASNKVFDTIDTLENLKEAAGADGDKIQLGTHFYAPKGVWNQFDHVLVSPTLLDGQGLAWVPGSTAVHAPDALKADSGAPRRYFLPHFKGDPALVDNQGASDHFPVAMRLRITGNDRQPHN